MIALHRIDHVALRVADLDEAAARWAQQIGLHVRERDTRPCAWPVTMSRTAWS